MFHIPFPSRPTRITILILRPTPSRLFPAGERLNQSCKRRRVARRAIYRSDDVGLRFFEPIKVDNSYRDDVGRSQPHAACWDRDDTITGSLFRPHVRWLVRLLVKRKPGQFSVRASPESGFSITVTLFTCGISLLNGAFDWPRIGSPTFDCITCAWGK